MLTGTDTFVIGGEDSNAFVISDIYLEQMYYWTKEWQEGELEADEDIKNGRLKKFASAQDAVKHLKRKQHKILRKDEQKRTA